MNRRGKILIFVWTALAAAIIGAAIVMALAARTPVRKVFFELTEGVSSATVSEILEEGGETSLTEVANLVESSQLKLRHGEYLILPSGQDIDISGIHVVVDESTGTILVDPAYSPARLEKQIISERPRAQQVVKQRYQGIIEEYIFGADRLYGKGDWYIAELVSSEQEPRSRADVYRVILRKTNDRWEIAAAPELVFSYRDYPDIPAWIIDEANQSIGEFN